MSDIRFFDSNDEMFNYLKEQNRKAKEWAERVDAISIIDAFNYFGFVEDDFLIIGKKLPATLPRDQYDSEEEYRWEFESEKANREEGYIFGMWYSVIAPGGELGTNHLSRCHPLPDDIGKAIISLISLK
jgi:hypothetical protein